MIIQSTDCKIPYENALNLKNNGHMKLGVVNAKAEQFVNTETYKFLLGGTDIHTAFRLYLFLALAVVAFSVYLSCIYEWWVFIIGILMGSFIANENKKGLVQNIVEEALKNDNVYTVLLNFGALIYDIKNEKLAKHLMETYKSKDYNKINLNDTDTLKRDIMNDALETVAKFSKMKEAQAIEPEVTAPYALPDKFIKMINEEPLIFIAYILKEEEARKGFLQWLDRAFLYIGAFEEINASNIYIDISKCAMKKADIEMCAKMSFLFIIFCDMLELKEKHNMVSMLYSYAFERIEITLPEKLNPQDALQHIFEKTKEKETESFTWLDNWKKMLAQQVELLKTQGKM